MPYITEDRREILDRPLHELMHIIKANPQDDGGFAIPYGPRAGDLNYIFSMIIKSYLEFGGSYQAINDVIGALECCKLELYRRQVAPYEDQKIEENGDI